MDTIMYWCKSNNSPQGLHPKVVTSIPMVKFNYSEFSTLNVSVEFKYRSIYISQPVKLYFNTGFTLFQSHGNIIQWLSDIDLQL